MIKLVENFKYYNANSKDKNTGDCVVRSLSLAYNMDYNQVRKELNKIKREWDFDTYRTEMVFSQFINKYGYFDYKSISNSDLTVKSFSENNLNGIYLIICGKTNSSSDHMVCIVDGTIYDSWDCSNYIVNRYYEIYKNRSNVSNTIDAEELKAYAKSAIENEIKRYNLSYGEFKMDDEPEFNNYTLDFECYYNVLDLNLADETDEFMFKFTYKFSPINTYMQNTSIIDKLTKNYIKKYISNMEKHIKEIKDNEDMLNQYQDKFFGTLSQEEVKNKLPVWCRKLITKIDIDNRKPNNRFSDKYQVGMQALPNDPRRPDEPTVYFYADKLDELIWQINKYKQDYSRLNWDY